jgi:hypothetical protein
MNPLPEPAAAPAGTLRQSLPARLQAAGIRLGLSAVILAAALYLVLARWYPGFHFGVDGGWQGARLILAVDLVLGPLLTFVVFNPFKARRLIAFDLACIGAAQLAALGWGFFTVHGQRPVSLNYHEGIFYSLPARSLQGQPGALAAIERASRRGPVLLYVAPPAGEAERQRAKQRAELGLMAHEDAAFFRPLAPHWEEIQSATFDAGRSRDAAVRRDLPAFLARHGGQAADYRFFRYQAGYGSCVIALTPRGELVDALGCERA